MSATSSRWSSPSRRLQARDAAEAIADRLGRAARRRRRRTGDPAGRAAGLRRRARQRRLRHAYRRQGQATDAAFAAAPHVVGIKIVNPRVVANFMEPRAALAEYDAESERLTLHVGSQGVHGMRDVIAEGILKIPPDKLRVVTKDVGGGFGTKGFVYREYPLVLEAARRLGAPVRWQADRTEHFVGDAQGRDNVTTAEMALDADGRFLALRVDILGNLGAYLSQFAPYIPWLGASMATGPYRHRRAARARARRLHPHRARSTPIAAPDGPRRPMCWSGWSIACARATGLAPEEIRARNFVKPAQMPYHTPDRPRLRRRRFRGRDARLPRQRPTVAGFARARRGGAKARLIRGLRHVELYRMHRLGRGRTGLGRRSRRTAISRVLIGTQSNGQGHETAYAQVVSQYLDVPLERMKVVQGDTDRIADRQRHRRLAIDSRRRGHGRRALRRRSPPRSRSSPRTSSGGGGRRPGDRRRPDPHRRHRPRDLLCRNRRAARRDAARS